MLKRISAVLLVICLVLALAACGGGQANVTPTQTQTPQTNSNSENSTNSGEKVKLTFETSVYVEAPHKKAIDGLIAEFNKNNPNIEIQVFGAGYDNFWDNLTTEVMADNQGDIVQVYPENIAQYDSLKPDGAFLDLNTYMNGKDFESKLVGQDLTKIKDKTVALSNISNNKSSDHELSILVSC